MKIILLSALIFLTSFSITEAAINIVPNGGTGVNTITGIIQGNGTTPFSAITVGTGLSFSGGTLSATGTGTVTSVTASSPIFSSGGTTPNLTIQVANTSQNGYLTSTDWNTFNNKQGTITLTTTGSSGVATFIANTLNIPNYTYTLPTASTIVLGGVKVDGTSITISGGVISAATSGGGTVTNVASADGSILVTNPTTTVDLKVIKATSGFNITGGNTGIGIATASKTLQIENALYLYQNGGESHIEAIGSQQLQLYGGSGGTGFRFFGDNGGSSGSLRLNNDSGYLVGNWLNSGTSVIGITSMDSSNNNFILQSGRFGKLIVAGGNADSQGSATDVAGTDLQLNGGRPTGSGAGGNILIQTAPASTTGTTLEPLVTRLQITSLGAINIPSLTASKVIFTDSSKNLTSTGIGTSSQFIKGDGSLDSTTYLSTIANLTATDSTLTFSGTYDGTIARTIGLNLGQANTWTGQQTFNTTAPKFGTITGSTQCLHVDTTGLVSGTGSDCGSSGGGGVSTVASADGSITVSGTTAIDLAVVKAPKLTTARTIAGVSFDGSANISIPASGLSNGVTGSGAIVLATSPTLTTAILGSSTATTQSPNDNSTKLATTAYVDTAVLGQNFKEAARVATTANLVGVYVSGVFTYTATGTDTIDGTTLVLGDRVLVKNQTTTFQNGIYTVTTAGAIGVAGILTRSTDANTSAEFKTGDSIFITSGTALSSTSWAYTGVDSPTLGTDAITYAQVAGQGSFTGGNGITITGTSIAIDTSVTVDKTTAQTLTNKTLTTPVINGAITGTGQATAATASTIVMRDSNANTSVNNLVSGFTTTATAAGTTTMTIGATGTQVWTGSSTQTVKLPTTSVLQGQQYQIINQSSGAVTIQSSGANTITILAANTSALFTAVVATPTTAANWSSIYSGQIVTSGKSLSVSNTLTLAGTDGTTMTFPSTSATIARTDAANTFTGVQTMTSPVFTTPVLGTPSSGTLTNVTGLPEGGLALTDITTNNSSTSNHGFLKKLDNNAAHYMDGTGAWSTPPSGGEWTYLSKQSYAAASGTVSFTSLAVHDTYKAVIRLHNTTSTDITTVFTMNNITASNYRYTNQGTGGLVDNNGVASMKIFNQGSTAGPMNYEAEVVMTGKHFQGIKTAAVTYNGNGNQNTSGNQLWMYNGGLSSDSNDLTRLDFTVTGVATGTIELWYKDAQ